MSENTASDDRDLARYQEALRHARHKLRQRLSSAEMSAVLDVLNGHWFSEPSSISYIYAEVEDAVELNRLDEKWGINGRYLVTLLSQLSYIESCALADAAEQFWTRVSRGENDLSPEDAFIQ